jgi:hypothetical protein
MIGLQPTATHNDAYLRGVPGTVCGSGYLPASPEKGHGKRLGQHEAELAECARACAAGYRVGLASVSGWARR